MRPLECPDCGDPLAYTFTDTAGVGAWKRGEGYNTTPDTAHYVCFPCAKAWKQRQDGPLTPDPIGDLVFFSCKDGQCGAPLMVTRESSTATEVELMCPNGHYYRVAATDDGGLTLEGAR
jgi:hypothetical protein